MEEMGQRVKIWKKTKKSTKKKSIKKSTKKKSIKKDSKKSTRPDFSKAIPLVAPPLTCNYAPVPELPYPCMKKSKIPLKPQQRRVVQHMLQHRGLLVVHGVGAGKTLPAVVLVNCFLPHMSGYVITPKSLISNFRKEMQAYGVSPDHPGLHYTTFEKFTQLALANPLLLKDKFVIIDEAHNLSNFQGVRTSTIVNAVHLARKVLLLTATPMKNRTVELNPLYEMVSGRKLKNRQIVVPPAEWKCLVSYYRCPKSEHYPSSTHHDVKLKMSPEFFRLYRQVETNQIKNHEIKDIFGENVKDLTAFFNGIRRATNNLENVESPKVAWALDHIQQTKRQTLVYSFFREAGLDLLKHGLQRDGVSFAEITGASSVKTRDAAVKAYNTNQIQVLLISKAGAEGLDLKGTRSIIILEPGWNESGEEQVQGRGIRFGSHLHLPLSQRHVDVYHLQMAKPGPPKDHELPSIDELMRYMQKTKANKVNEYLHYLMPFTIEKNKC